jgi:hypothetical protein
VVKEVVVVEVKEVNEVNEGLLVMVMVGVGFFFVCWLVSDQVVCCWRDVCVAVK